MSIVSAFVAALLASANSGSTDAAVTAAEKTIDAKSLLERTKTLASDRFEGRAPGTKGEDVTVDYLVDTMKAIGLEPGNPDGTFVQNVPLVGATTNYRADLDTAGKHQELIPGIDLGAVSHRLVPNVTIQHTDMVFVGYGVVAPEYGWDDFKDVDVRGKTIVMLVNDPQVVDPANPTKLDTSVFKGGAMTYYGRWTYKFDIAAQKGAAAVLLVHDTALAGYPFTVIDGRGRETFDTVSADKNAGRVAIESWISNEAAHKLFELSNLDLDAQAKAAASRDFRPIPLRSKLSMTLERTERKLVSHNVVGKISGSDPSAAARYLIYTAHWDHLGRDDKRSGDPIFHGALDNASGVAGMLEIAEAWKALETPPKETVVFIATTCEERGLLGAKYYVNNPLYPLERTLAVLNFDFLNPWGRTADLQRIGERRSSLDDVLERVLKQRGRVVSPEGAPEEGLTYRADDFVFAKAGVPAMWCFRGIDFIGKPKGYGKEKYVDYIAHDYHQPSDVVRPDWDVSGAIEDLRVYFRVGHIVGEDKVWPEWLPNAEFAAKRRETASSRAPATTNN